MMKDALPADMKALTRYGLANPNRPCRIQSGRSVRGELLILAKYLL